MRNKKRRANSWLVFSVQYISIALKMHYSFFRMTREIIRVLTQNYVKIWEKCV